MALPLIPRLFQFQSTLPVRGATRYIRDAALDVFISIHAPRAGSDPHTGGQIAGIQISIHAPRAGSDSAGMKLRALRGKFQSTLPVRGATVPLSARHLSATYFNPRSPCGERLSWPARDIDVVRISIHAPRAGSDIDGHGDLSTTPHFNPRSPCGERHHPKSGI